MKAVCLRLLATGLIISSASAHEMEEANIPLVETGLDVYLSYSYRNKSYAEQDSEWQIPGALMGGEAFPVDEDAGLDNAVVDYQYAFSPDNGVQLTGEAHSGHGETSFSFAHYWYKHQWRTANSTVWRIEAGRMAAAFSPLGNYHASRDPFSEATLAGDIFFGRSFVDNGLRGSVLLSNWTFGAELWNGKSWLAQKGQAADVFAFYRGNHGMLDYSIGAWAMYAESEERRDIRYFGGHTHGNVVVSSNDLKFTGDNQVYGIDAALFWRTGEQSKLGVTLSLSEFLQDGDIVESQRMAELESDHQAWILGAQWQLAKHELVARYESLQLDNTLRGSAAVVIGRDTSLDNPEGLEPERTTLTYRYHYSPALTLRLEWIDESISDSDQQRWVAGFVLRGMFE